MSTRKNRVWFIEGSQKVGEMLHVVRTSPDYMTSQHVQTDTVSGRITTNTFHGEQSLAAAWRAFNDIVITAIHGAQW